MLFKSIAAFSTLALVENVLAAPETQTVSLVFGAINPQTGDSPADELGAGINGQIEGTGPDGTTYVISNSPTASDDFVATITAVQDATHLSAFVSVETEGATLIEHINCGFDSVSATCTYVAADPESTGTGTLIFSTAGAADFEAVVITGTASASGSGSGSQTATSSGTAASSSSSSAAGKIVVGGISSLIASIIGASALL